jgi:hypothetical protein
MSRRRVAQIENDTPAGDPSRAAQIRAIVPSPNVER